MLVLSERGNDVRHGECYHSLGLGLGPGTHISEGV
jgi:hypothetical protein